MPSRTSFRRKFNVHLDCGSIIPHVPSFTAGVIAETDVAYTPISDDEVIAEALRIISRRMARGPALNNPSMTREYLMLRFAGLEHEVFTCLFLDNRNRVIVCEELFRGTVDGASVHPREVVKRALRYNAAAVILAHNHPSGIAEPSSADELITRRLKEALIVVDIRILDHLVIAGATAESFAERGLL